MAKAAWKIGIDSEDCSLTRYVTVVAANATQAGATGLRAFKREELPTHPVVVSVQLLGWLSS